MKRSQPLFSVFSIACTAVLLAGLAFAMWRSGNQIFSPGKVSAKEMEGVTLDGFSSHAEFEGDCARCHAPLSTTQDVLCVQCHTGVQDQIASGQGIHGRKDSANRCFACHLEHRGRQFDPSAAARIRFDHSLANFSLVKHQVDYAVAPLDCAACHRDDQAFSSDQESCRNCHADHDLAFTLQHVSDYGPDCQGCHDGLDTLSQFAHDPADFSLKGKHSALFCADCHGRNGPAFRGAVGSSLTFQSFREISPACTRCHREPDIHRGVFKDECQECHNQEAWSPATLDGQPFDHASGTHFSLARHGADYQGRAMDCRDCHGSNLRAAFDLQVCVDCHSRGSDPQGGDPALFMAEHVDQFGPACLDCHDGVDRLSNFDHAQVFPLEGAHAAIQCTDCHQDRVFKGTPGQCVGCHAEPEIHAGSFGLECQYCHSVEAWTPASLRLHTFPLDHGGQGEVACTTCHVAEYSAFTCYGCHEHQPTAIQEEHIEEGISVDELPACAQCHPAGREE